MQGGRDAEGRHCELAAAGAGSRRSVPGQGPVSGPPVLLPVPSTVVRSTAPLHASLHALQAGGATFAPYVCTSYRAFTACAVLHGKLGNTALYGSHRPHAWVSTARDDAFNTPADAAQIAQQFQVQRGRGAGGEGEPRASAGGGGSGGGGLGTEAGTAEHQAACRPLRQRPQPARPTAAPWIVGFCHHAWRRSCLQGRVGQEGSD